jgi:hypothetical protein
MRFINRERFRELGDKRLTSLGIFLKWYTMAYVLLFVATVLQFLGPLFNRLAR